MPTLPTYTKCSHLACKNQRSSYNQFCAEHGGIKKQTENKKQSDAMYQTAQWKARRKIELSRHPLCQSCLTRGIVTQANEVDHVFPWNKIGKQAFYNNLFQSLCKDCHSYKTAQEQKGTILFFDDEVITYGLQDYAFCMLDSRNLNSIG